LSFPSVVRAFFDSSVLVCAYSADDSYRRAIAADLVALHTRAGSLVISVQEMMETHHVLTRRKTKAPGEVLATLRLLATNQVVSPDADVAMLALRLCADHQSSPSFGPLPVTSRAKATQAKKTAQAVAPIQALASVRTQQRLLSKPRLER
jgi:predicted nucleic acid-binding protein